MRLSEQLVIDVYQSDPSIWKGLWKKTAAEDLARKARGFITSIFPLSVDPRIWTVLEPLSRSSVDSSATVVGQIAASIRSCSAFRSKLEEKFTGGTLRPPSGSALDRLIQGAVEDSINSPAGAAILTSVSEADLYPALARLLSDELFTLSSTRQDERLILNYALLVYHLHRWRIPLGHLNGLIASLETGVQGIRGKLISIQSHHPQRTAYDLFQPPPSLFQASHLPDAIRCESNLLEAIQTESREIERENGFFHRLMPTNNPVSPALLSGAAYRAPEFVEAGRKLIYPLFEHTAMTFMSLTAIEFLLRTHCLAAHPPDEPLEAVLKSYTSLSEELRHRIHEIFSANRLNLRNRCVHGALLEIEGRREDAIRSSGILEAFGVPTTDIAADGSLPASLSALVLNTLQSLAEEIEAAALPADASWTRHYLLTETEDHFASKISCDFIEPEDAEVWIRQISDYLNQATPCLSSPLRIGIICWFKDRSNLDNLPGFFFLTLLFEPLLRLTLHLGGRPVLQDSMSLKGAAHYRVQYFMIDGRGLLTADNKEWLTGHLSGADKDNALEVLRLATKCRDAVAHGAIHQFSADLLLVYGHAVVKAMQLLVEVGQRNLGVAPLAV